MQDLSDGVYINMVNHILARRDSYLEYIKAGTKQDALTFLRTAPIHMSALFTDHLISKAEEDTNMRTNVLLVPYTKDLNVITLTVRLATLSPPTSEAGGSIPVKALYGKAGSCLPLVGSLQYRTLANSMYWFPLPFQLPVAI